MYCAGRTLGAADSAAGYNYDRRFVSVRSAVVFDTTGSYNFSLIAYTRTRRVESRIRLLFSNIEVMRVTSNLAPKNAEF
jgi:hypothetical protein